eukprot:gene7475-9969_t
MLLGGVAFLRDQHREANELCEKAVALAPSDSWAMAYLGLVCGYSRRIDRAIEVLLTALRLSPHPPIWYYESLAIAYLWAGNLADAEKYAKLSFRFSLEEPVSYMELALVYAFQGRKGDAARTIAELKAAFPGYSAKDVSTSERYLMREDLDRVLVHRPEPRFFGERIRHTVGSKQRRGECRDDRESGNTALPWRRSG